ncbi:hypothetical protein CAOG_04538 [Capsaspora owczarzaki ATCC 30864]|nr:hypothetical protein CAOG_04538 [Capsaspora owczarzaki ATCC 30864]|eukprot:XP_004347285.1 hypothetical protein CAOG_04538 [Capsaspora owczarzaki ATCC 30864]
MRNRTPLSKHAFRVLLLVFVALIVTLSVLLKVLVLDRGDSDPCLTTDVLISSQASMDTFLQSGCTVVRNLALVNLSPEGTTPLETSDELHLLMSPDQDRAVDAVPLSRLDYWQSKIANTSFSANRPPIDVAALNYNAPETDARAFMLDAPAWMLLSTALANLHTISGDFSVVNCTIRSLRMTALTSVGGSITIRRNPSLVSLYMPVLQQGAGNLEVAYNPFLLYMYFPQLVQLENMAILAQMSLPKLDFPMLHSISELSITWQPYLHNISFGQLNTADNVKLIMLYTSAFGTESCELHFPSMTYTQSLLVKNVYQLGKLDVTSLAQASYLDFSTIFMGKTRVLVSSDSDENVTQVLVGDEHFTFPSLVTSDLTISFSNVFGCIELNFPSLLTCAHFALASNTFLSTVNMPALVTADELDIRFNPNLVNVSAPILRQVTSAFFLVANWALKRVLFPDLQEATVLVTLSYDLENITLGLTRGSVAIVSNPVLKAISLPRLDAVAMLAILDNLVLESISLPVLTTVGSAGYVANSPPLGLAWIIGHENILDNFPPNRTASDTYEIGAQLVSGLLAMWANPQLTNFSAPLANYAVNVFVQNNPSLCFDMDTLPSLQTLQVSCLHGNRQGCLGAAINNTLSSCNTPPAPSSSISSRMVGSQPIASAPYSAGSASMLGGNSPVRWRRQGLRGV